MIQNLILELQTTTFLMDGNGETTIFHVKMDPASGEGISASLNELTATRPGRLYSEENWG